MKWNASNISLFLQLYQHFPALWNIKHKDYTNKRLKDTLFKQLMSELEANKLLGQMDEKQLKSKIKSLKDVYRVELSKIEKSKKSGCGTDDVYVPRLNWFNDGRFLSEVLATRGSTSNLDLSQSLNSEQDEDGGNTIYPDEPGIGEKSTAKRNTSHFSGVMKPPEPPKKRNKIIVDNPADNEISQAIQKLDDIANKASVEKPYDQFGLHVAAELRQLPNRAAILLQQEIQNSITRYKLNISDNESIQQDVGNYAVLQSPQSMTSVGSSNEEDDIPQIPLHPQVDLVEHVDRRFESSSF